MRRIGDLPFVAAVRYALPWSFIGLGAAFTAVIAIQLRDRDVCRSVARTENR